MLQEYLNKQFLQTTDDANFEKLKKTCSDIAKKVSKDKIKILNYSLVAFDPEIPADNPEIIDIQNQIIQNWKTFIPNSKDTVITIVRAVMLEILQVASKDANSSYIIWFASRNSFKHFKLGREKDILANFLMGLGNNIESQVSESWLFSPDKKIDIPKVSNVFIDENDLSTITPTTIKDAFGKTLKKLTVDLKQNQTDFANQIVLMQMRTQLLWWKESSYSISKKVNYKSMKEGELQVLLAYDYCYFIPEMYPVSVDYFLIETLKSLSINAEKKITILEFLNIVEESSSDLKNILPDFISENGRISFANFINGLVHGKHEVRQFKSLVGVSEATELSSADFTLWIFHDLHSIKLSISK